MKIALINGSPKVAESASKVLLSDLKIPIGNKAELVDIELHRTTINSKDMGALMESDVWVFSFPLYTDCTPGHFLTCLVDLEQACKEKKGKDLCVYAIINCGLYEGIQTETAFRIIENWCNRAGVTWCGGVGIGGGGLLTKMPDFKEPRIHKKTIYKSFEPFAESILKKKMHKIDYISVGVPLGFYQFTSQLGWRIMIKHAGKKVKDLGYIPENDD